MANLRAFLVLGRVSNLPTVWSNCLAGWLLSGGGASSHFALLLFAATSLYIGGMYLNDAFDAQFDRRHRPERPIPSGAVRAGTVWMLGIGFLVVGLACLSGFGKATMILTLLLLVAILVYDAVHKIFALSPVVMALCRFFLVLVAASLGRDGVTGLAIWSALVLAAYVVGLSYLARAESTSSALRQWPSLLLAAPLVLAFIVNQGEPLLRAMLLMVVLTVWMLRCLRFTLWSPQRNVGRTVGGLLAGIPLLDLLAVWEGGPLVAVVFFALFGLALLLQRFVPAT